MKFQKLTHTIALILSSITSLFAHGTATKAEPAKTKFSKKSQKSSEDRTYDVTSLVFTPGQLAANQLEPGQRFPWKKDIVTTVFWIGEKPAPKNPVPNRVSCWDTQWTKNYGGVDAPDPTRRSTTFCKFRRNRIHSTHFQRQSERASSKAPSVVPGSMRLIRVRVSTCKGC
jgi:hypothetical protein